MASGSAVPEPLNLFMLLPKLQELGEHSPTDMKTETKSKFIILSALLSAFNVQPVAFAQGTAFTYQGQLNVSGVAASGSYDIAFSLYATNAGGVAVAGPVTNSAVGVTNGLFTTTVDFGNVFTGASNWLAIAVSTNGANTFSTLAPRQQLTPTPYAIFSESANGLGGTLSASQLTSIGNTNGGTGNFFVGPSGNATTTGTGNTANGVNALNHDTSGSYNTANGYDALYSNTNGVENTANGLEALYDNTSGSYNTANGAEALAFNKSGSGNTGIGFWALFHNSSGSNNIALGYQAGLNITNGGNIDIGNQGLATDTKIIRIGDVQTQTFIAGVITGDGSGLTNVALLNGGNAFTGNQTVTGGNVGIGTNNPQEALHVVGNILATGTVTGSSDRNAKENFAAVNPVEVLDKVAALPISRWNYKSDREETHLGPMAQDFYAAFGLGMDDKHISMVDADGVALAAIQGLNHKLEEARAENAELKARLDKLEKLLNNRLNGGGR